jgi:hypothetical protein
MCTPVNTDTVIFWIMTSYNLVDGCQGSDESSLFPRNVKTCLSESATGCYKRIGHSMEDKVILSEWDYNAVCNKEIK